MPNLIDNRSIAALIITLALASCKSNLASPEVSTDVSYLSGKIEPYNLGSGVVFNMERVYRWKPDMTIDSIVVIASCTIDSTGNFSLPLHTPPSVFLGHNNGLSARFYFSDSSALFFPQSSFSLYKNGIRVGSAYCSDKPITEDPFGGTYTEIFWFSTANVFVAGQDTVWHSIGFTVSEYTLHFAKGWNQVIWSRDVSTDTLTHCTFTVDNEFKGKWHVNTW